MIVSFIIIAFNEKEHILDVLESIYGLAGLPGKFEIIIVDDGSTDGMTDIVKEYSKNHRQIRPIVFEKNKGRGPARSAGVASAKGEYIAFVDADIILPEDWLVRCLRRLKKYDACGGIAVPDGDVSWLSNTFKLSPKIAAHETTVSGGNGLFKRTVFDKVHFNRSKKHGEDVDLGYQIKAAGLKTTSIDDLIVKHNESKNFSKTIGWLFTSGKGASRQFYEHKDIRLPDLAFFGFVIVLILAVVALIFVPIIAACLIAVLLLYLLLSSLLHTYGKFELQKTPMRSAAAILANTSLLSSYYLGRLVGFITEFGKDAQ